MVGWEEVELDGVPCICENHVWLVCMPGLWLLVIMYGRYFAKLTKPTSIVCVKEARVVDEPVSDADDAPPVEDVDSEDSVEDDESWANTTDATALQSSNLSIIAADAKSMWVTVFDLAAVDR